MATTLLKTALPVLLLFALISAGAATGANAQQGVRETAIFAGGCFWCVESDFDKVPGVIATVSGYTGGKRINPTYRQVSAGATSHIEAVKIVFDPKKVSYKKLLHIFWRSVDPTDDGGQFCDRGTSYKTAIFATSAHQKKLAAASKKQLQSAKVLKNPIVTPVRDALAFYKAEEYHQDYHNKNPVRYKFYRYSCGRDARIRSIWGGQAHSGIPQS